MNIKSLSRRHRAGTPEERGRPTDPSTCALRPAGGRAFGAPRGRALRHSARALLLSATTMVTLFGLMAHASADTVPNLPVPLAGGGDSAALSGLGGDSVLPGMDAMPNLSGAGGGSGLPGTNLLADLPGTGGQPVQPGTDAVSAPAAPDAQPTSCAGDREEPPPGIVVTCPPGPPGTSGQCSDPNTLTYGTPSNVATWGGRLPNGDTVYPGSGSAQDFNGSDGGWTARTDHELLQLVPGLTSIDYEYCHVPDGGVTGKPGDGAFMVDGTSVAGAPCAPQTSVAVVESPMFVYDKRDVQGMTFGMDVLRTSFLVGDGHQGMKVELRKVKDNQVTEAQPVPDNPVTTVYGPEMTFPFDEWQHVESTVDHTKLVHGEAYVLAIIIVAQQSETAANIGRYKFDNVELTTHQYPVAPPPVPCSTGNGTSLPGLPPENPTGMCQLTNTVGQATLPVTDPVANLLRQPSIAQLLGKTDGVFAVVNPQTGVVAGYLIGREAFPYLKLQSLIAYVQDGTAGKIPGYVFLTVRNLIQMVKMILADPGGKVSSLLRAVLTELPRLLSGELTDWKVKWGLNNLMLNLQTILRPLTSNTPVQDTALGGIVFNDLNRNGILDDGEPGVPNVTVTLSDDNKPDKPIKTTVTGPDGRYQFTGLKPTSEPVAYYITFDKPDGSTFTTQYAPGSLHSNTSNANPDTGKTDRIEVFEGTQDDNWHAGIITGTPPQPPVPPQPPTPPAPCSGIGISAGEPTVNGKPAGSAPGPQVQPGSDITIKIPVTNTCSVPVTVTATLPDGTKLTCTPNPIKPGETAMCEVTIPAQEGEQLVTVNITATAENGEQQSTSCDVYYNGKPCDCATAETTTKDGIAPLPVPLG